MSSQVQEEEGNSALEKIRSTHRGLGSANRCCSTLYIRRRRRRTFAVNVAVHIPAAAGHHAIRPTYLLPERGFQRASPSSVYSALPRMASPFRRHTRVRSRRLMILPPSPASTRTASSSRMPQPGLHSIPSLAVNYTDLDAEDPTLDIGWLNAFFVFGFSPRNAADPRYRALAKFKAVIKEHGVDDLTINDFLLAVGVYAAWVDRNAKISLKDAQRSQRAVQSVVPQASAHRPTVVSPRKRPRAPPMASSSSFSYPSAPFEHSGERSSDECRRRWSLPERLVNLYEVGNVPMRGLRDMPVPDTPVLRPEDDSLHVPPQLSVRPEHVQLLYHMLRHAESIYGLPLNVASAPRVSLIKVTDRGIICRRTGIASSDIRVAQFTTDAFLPAHYVAVDRQIRAIIVCVRGTANIVDSLTDVAATHDPLRTRRSNAADDNDVVEGFGHTGVLRSARNLFRKIRKETLSLIREHPGYELLMTGHSLGAATAAVLAVIMRDDPDFPRATAICIAPPPCMTYELAEDTASHTITLVNGPDIVPRLSVVQMLPFMATARYVADLSRSQKALLGLGLRRAVINWQDLENHNDGRIRDLKHLHEGRRLYLPGKVFQMVKKNEVNRRDAWINKLFRRRNVEVVPVSRTNFLQVRGRERGMFLAHAPFSYKGNLMLALKGMDSGPLKKMHADSVLGNLLTLPVSKFLPDTYARKSASTSWDHLYERLADEGVEGWPGPP